MTTRIIGIDLAVEAAHKAVVLDQASNEFVSGLIPFHTDPAEIDRVGMHRTGVVARFEVVGLVAWLDAARVGRGTIEVVVLTADVDVRIRVDAADEEVIAAADVDRLLLAGATLERQDGEAPSAGLGHLLRRHRARADVDRGVVAGHEHVEDGHGERGHAGVDGDLDLVGITVVVGDGALFQELHVRTSLHFAETLAHETREVSTQYYLNLLK